MADDEKGDQAVLTATRGGLKFNVTWGSLAAVAQTLGGYRASLMMLVGASVLYLVPRVLRRGDAAAADPASDIRLRWDEMVSVKCGYLNYPPMLTLDGTERPTGFGLELLDFLLNRGVQRRDIDINLSQPLSWNDIEKPDKLLCDIIATPLFATPERAKALIFSAPLFFSNIGLFVKADIGKDFHPGLALDRIKKLFEDPKYSDLIFLGVPGEISSQLAAEHFPKKVRRLSNDSIGLLLEKVADRFGKPQALFCEASRAELSGSVRSGDVVNILQQRDILYPVCFALRQGQHELANLINIRLLELNLGGSRLASRGPGALQFLKNDDTTKDYIASHKAKPEDICKHFVTAWPDPPPAPQAA